ncbi:MAG TPA: hypothetical protein VLX92_22775, partial [Kofleriaceae bacterium]|nr:hypothetical protein [Kofleriaceae bacterium]
MDRNLRLRELALVIITILCVSILLPSFTDKSSLPSWFRAVFSKQISLGLDLQGGKHIVYNIALDKAIDDKASDIKRELESDTELGLTVKTPSQPRGALTVILSDPSKKQTVIDKVNSDYHGDVGDRTCNESDLKLGKSVVCFAVTENYADSLEKDALTSAVSTIRERINQKGVAEPSVVEKGQDIIVELPGDPNSDAIKDTEELIARTAKLEMKVVDDCSVPNPRGCTASSSAHDGSPYMNKLFIKAVGNDRANPPVAPDPEAVNLGIKGDIDIFGSDEGGEKHKDPYLFAYNTKELVPLTWAKKHQKAIDQDKIEGNKVWLDTTGREIIERYMFGDKDLGVVGLVDRDPEFKIPDDHELGFEEVEPQKDASDQRKFWRTYW